MGTAGALLITAGSVVSMLGNNMGQVLTGSRILFALGENGDLPADEAGRWAGREFDMIDGFLERVWAFREEQIYPDVFGDLGNGIFTLDQETFGVFEQRPDPRWLFTGVFESAPSWKHLGWLYVSSGLSNPWEQEEPNKSPDEPSWLGVEFFLHTTERGPWAIRILQRVAAFEILLAHDRYPGRERLGFGDRIPLRGPMVPQSESLLTHLLVAPPATLQKRFQLQSGWVDLVQLVGVTESEAAYGRENGLEPLIEILDSGGAYSVSDPWRQSLV